MLPLAGMDAVELDKKRKQLAVTGLIDAAYKQKDDAAVLRLRDWLGRIESIADGNPRLLMWLDQVVCSGEVDEAAVLAELESTREAFRSDVLATLLLGMVSAKGKAVLVKGLVFRLAVPIEVFKSVCGEVEIDRSISLGLLEVMPEGTVRVSRVLPLVEPEDEELAQAAAREVYEIWYKESETSTEEQKLEIHRLAIVAKDGEIAGTIARSLSIKWKDKGRSKEAKKLCEATVEITRDFKVLHQLARSEEVLGNNRLALQLYQEALEKCPIHDETDVLKEKSAIIHNMAGIYANQGQVEQAIELYQQSLAINEQIGNVQTKAATLAMMGQLLADVNLNVVQGLIYLKESREILLHLKSPSAQVVQEIIERIEK